MKPYTVLILRPDYVTDDYGQNTYLTHVKAIDVHEARKIAQKEVAASDAGGAMMSRTLATTTISSSPCSKGTWKT